MPLPYPISISRLIQFRTYIRSIIIIVTLKCNIYFNEFCILMRPKIYQRAHNQMQRVKWTRGTFPRAAGEVNGTWREWGFAWRRGKLKHWALLSSPAIQTLICRIWTHLQENLCITTMDSHWMIRGCFTNESKIQPFQRHLKSLITTGIVYFISG